MTVKENPKVVGEMPCITPKCTCIAEVRQRQDGKKLKYLYCSKHKILQPSGPDFQKFVTDSMQPVGTLKELELPPTEDNKTGTDTEKETDEQTEIIQPKGELWRSQSKPGKKDIEKSEGQTEVNTGISTIHVVCGVGVVAVIGFGIWYFLRAKPKKQTENEPSTEKSEAS